MDILNWIYLVKNKLRKTTIQNPDKDLVILGADVGYSKRGDGYQSYGMHVTDFANALLSGTDYAIVQAKGTPEENAQEFITAYAKAVAADRDNENRFTLVLAPGHYKFQETFLHQENFIDIVSLTGEQDVIFDLELNGLDPFREGTPAYIYDLTIQANTTYTDSLQSGIPSFLAVDEAVVDPSHGFNSTGMYFTGDADEYPVYSDFVIPENQTAKITFKFIHSYNCSDQGVCVYLDGDTPAWNWGPDSTRIAASYNCEDPYVLGTTVDDNDANILVEGNTYIAEFTYNPTGGTSTLVTKDLTGTILSTVSINEVLDAGDYRIAFSADSGDGLSTSPVMNIDTSNTKVSGIKTKEYTSANYQSWALAQYNNTESDFYPLPLNVILGNHTELEVKNCTAGPFSFGVDTTDNNFGNANDLTATFIDCTALGYSFGYGAFQIESNAVFTNCSAGNNSFYIDDDLRGTYTNCTAGNNSFYSIDDDIEGDFINCTAGDFSFFTDGDDILGTFTNCTGGVQSFYANDYINAEFTNCKAKDDSFWADGNELEGSFNNCQAGTDSFRAEFSNNGEYINCIGRNGSFSSDDPSYLMTNYYCLLYGSIFGGGTQDYCVDGI